MSAAAPADTLRFRSLDPGELERFLQRQKAAASLGGDIDLGLQLRQILEKARELVPSESGSILLDDPLRKVDDRARNDLFFVAAFGPAAEALPGRQLPATEGVVGQVYRLGEPHLSSDVRTDRAFSREIDARTGNVTRSVVAAPIAIGSTVCGVIELVNRLEGTYFTERDLVLLEIFASYTSSTLQNALDAKRAHELARRDDLTGLYNDRWLHHRLVEVITEADASGRPCSLIFMDLDHFKRVNDTHGHLVGSQVLREVGFLLKRVVEVEGALVARYGGDEFVIALPRTPVEAAVRVAEETREAIAQATYVERDHGPGVPALHLRGAISASFGVAEYRPDARGSAHEKESALLRRADAAMYAAKAQGKNLVIAAEDDNASALVR